MPQLEPFDPGWLQVSTKSLVQNVFDHNQLEKMMGGRQTLPAEPVADARARFKAVFDKIKPLLPLPTDAVVTNDTTVPLTGLKIRIYKPKGAKGGLPVGLYIHSGGWYAGSIDTEDYLARNISVQSQIILYSPDYRLAPEKPYPAGHNDVYAAWEYMVQTAAQNGGDPQKRFVMGGSAGGNLAASICLKYALDVRLMASGAIIACPGTAHPKILTSIYKDRYHPELYSDSPMIGNDLLRRSWEWLASKPEDPLASVILHPNIQHLPQMYIAATTKDPTYPETIFFAEKCRENGVQMELVEWKGLPHFFHAIPSPMATKFMLVWNENLQAMIIQS